MGKIAWTREARDWTKGRHPLPARAQTIYPYASGATSCRVGTDISEGTLRPRASVGCAWSVHLALSSTVFLRISYGEEGKDQRESVSLSHLNACVHPLPAAWLGRGYSNGSRLIS